MHKYSFFYYTVIRCVLSQMPNRMSTSIRRAASTLSTAHRPFFLFQASPVQAKQAVQPQQILVRPHRSVSHAVVKAHHLLRILVHSYDVPVDAVSSHAERGRRVKRYHPLVAKTCKAAPQHTTIRRHGTTLMQPSNVQWTGV